MVQSVSGLRSDMNDVLPGPNAASKTPREMRATRMPAKLNPVDINVDDSPHPMAAHPIHMRGGNSLDVTVAGI